MAFIAAAVSPRVLPTEWVEVRTTSQGKPITWYVDEPVENGNWRLQVIPAEFVVLTIEADRRDKLKNVEFALDLSEPELWVLPFEGEAEVRNLVLAG